MSVDPKEQNAALLKMIDANKKRLHKTQETIKEVQKRTEGHSRQAEIEQSKKTGAAARKG